MGPWLKTLGVFFSTAGDSPPLGEGLDGGDFLASEFMDFHQHLCHSFPVPFYTVKVASSYFRTISFVSPKIFWILGSTKFVNIHPIPPRLAGARRGRAAVLGERGAPNLFSDPSPFPMEVWMKRPGRGFCAQRF